MSCLFVTVWLRARGQVFRGVRLLRGSRRVLLGQGELGGGWGRGGGLGQVEGKCQTTSSKVPVQVGGGRDWGK